MAVIKRVILQRNVICEKCKEVISAGNEVVKDRRTKGKTKYFHTNHVK